MTVTVHFLITFSSFLLENKNFFTFEVIQYGGGHFGTFNGGSSNFYIATVFYKHDAVELNLRPFFSF